MQGNKFAQCEARKGESDHPPRFEVIDFKSLQKPQDDKPRKMPHVDKARKMSHAAKSMKTLLVPVHAAKSKKVSQVNKARKMSYAGKPRKPSHAAFIFTLTTPRPCLRSPNLHWPAVLPLTMVPQQV